MSSEVLTQSEIYDFDLLIELYDGQKWTVDMLPHTAEEEHLVNTYNAMKGTTFTDREIYVVLMNLRKRSILKPKGRKNASSRNRPRNDGPGPTHRPDP